MGILAIIFIPERDRGGEIPPTRLGRGALIDPEIAGLVALLNRAGIKTVQSCQDIGDEADREADEADEDEIEIPRLGIIVVAWETFPALAALLSPVFGEAECNETGLFYIAHSDAKYVSVIFPWRDLGEFAETVQARLAARAD